MEWFDAEREDLPHADAKHPDVACGREPPEVDGLRRHPLDGQLALGRFVVGVVLDPPAQAKVGQLDAVVRRDQNVPGRDVAVNKFFGLQVGQGRGQLMHEED